MSVRQRITGAAIPRCSRTVATAVMVAAVLLAVLASPALASSTQRSILQDDNQLIYSSPSQVQSAMIRMRSLGVDVIKVSVVWSLVAPDANGKKKPNFDATNPNAYPQYAWDRYDRIVELAQKLGLTVFFQLTAPAPTWATKGGSDPGGYRWSHEPNAGYFGQFAKAVGKRYSGSFVPPGGAGNPPVTVPVGLATPSPEASTLPTTPGALPAVRWWSLWNEPDIPGWLSPQYHRVGHRSLPFSPVMWRGLLDRGYAGLVATGHRHDKILIGEITSGGNVHPVPFLRDLYCVNVQFQPLRGSSARAFGCPTSGSRSAFTHAHPGLFYVGGFADHPYSLTQGPSTPARTGMITMANLGVLERMLGQLFRVYRVRGNLPVYITEYGYKTKPPNPYVHTSLFQQEVYINQAESIAWRMPWVKSVAQFELTDDKPYSRYRRGSVKYWSTFQTGLEFSNGKPKPSYGAYRMPIWVASPHPGRSVAVWGTLRPANHSTAQTGMLQYRSSGRAKWSTLKSFRTRNSEGYFLERARISRPGMVRVGWQNPGDGSTVYSRAVSIHH